jgi:phage-related minor tail protein
MNAAIRTAALCAVAACACALLLSIRAAVVGMPSMFDSYARVLLAEARGTRAGVVAEVRTGREDLARRAERQIAAARADAVSTVKESLKVADRRIGDTLDRVDAGIAEVRGIRGDLRPVLGSADETLQQASGTLAVIRPQALGLIAAAKVTFGEAAQAARRVDAALPRALLRWDQIGADVQRTTDASAQASEATARTMAHLEEATKPLPKWLRYPLSIVGAAAPAVSGAVSTAAAVGAFR